jgi:hypothetical protein
MTRLSRQGRDVLEALAQRADGRLDIWRLVKRLQPRHGSQASTRASLSRTLRRLWRAGLVELEHAGGLTLREMHVACDAELARFNVDPEADYAGTLAKIASGRIPALFAHASAAAYFAERRRYITGQTCHMRAQFAVLTAAGRERMALDTAADRTVNKQPRDVNRNEAAV